ncbi:unnamed protein product [Brassicogethes aeneus]|uniref:Uncharacterized protein n=1 Tax=Brassicogethes aeneus TaxID=1431903 RepID=A0A9P0FIB4_BRAAE|nr:unnamed protein product [Brassicogethes aeneus]
MSESGDFVREKLIQYGLESFTDTFKENKIDESIWSSLKGEILKDLIPQVGLRIKFQQQIRFNLFNLIAQILTNLFSVQSVEHVIEEDSGPIDVTFLLTGPLKISPEKK